jgi:aspartyl-tRNA(Asn)/glutamyl-tRNA(Gln) amidotransferase subunit C
MAGVFLCRTAISKRIRRAAILELQRSISTIHPRTPRKFWNGVEQRMAAKVTVKEVERVAELAHLELAPEETGRMLRDLNAILDYVAELNELDTQGVVPLAQVSELEEAGAAQPRADQVKPSLDRAVVMAQTPETDQVFFKVPKVIER